MKKLLCAALVLVMSIMCALALVACGGNEGGKTNDAEIAKAAIKTVRGNYIDKAEETPADYTVLGQVKQDGKTYDVKWSVSPAEGCEYSDITPYVKVGEMDAATKLVTISVTKAEKEIKYVLTASVTVGSATETTQLRRTVPSAPAADGGTEAKPYTVAESLTIISELGEKEYYNDENGQPKLVYVKGYVTDVGKVNSGNTRLNDVYIADEKDGKETLLVYSITFDDKFVTKKGDLAVGDLITVKGYFQKYSAKKLEVTYYEKNSVYTVALEKAPDERTDAQKVADALATADTDLKARKYTEAGEVNLPESTVNGVEFTWASNNQELVTVAGNKMNIVSVPDTEATVELTLTAKLGTTEDTKTFALTVVKVDIKAEFGVEHYGTEADPFTVADALKVITTLDGNTKEYYTVNGQPKEVYVKGYVTDAGSVNDTGTRLSDVYIADEKDGTETLLVYSITFDKQFVTKDGDLAKGDLITIKGFLQKRYDKLEVTYSGNNNVLTVALEKGDGTNPNPPAPVTYETITVAKANEILATLESGKTYSDEAGAPKYVYVKGYVTVPPVTADKFFSKFYIADTKDTTQEQSLYVYSADYTTAAPKGTALAVGDLVVVKGYLYNYNGTPEIGTPNGKTYGYPSIVEYTPVGGTTPVEKTDAEKVTDALAKVNDKLANITVAGETVLPTSSVDGVTFAWVSGNTAVATVEGGKLVVSALPATDTDVTLTLTATCGAETQNKTVTVTVKAPVAVDPNALTATVNIPTYAAANGWTHDTRYFLVNLDSNIKVETNQGTKFNGRYWESTGNNPTKTWRLYQNETPTLTFTAATGYTIASVKITYLVSKTGVLVSSDGATQYLSDEVIAVNANTISFGVGNTESTVLNGNIQITDIEVKYTAPAEVAPAKNAPQGLLRAAAGVALLADTPTAQSEPLTATVTISDLGSATASKFAIVGTTTAGITATPAKADGSNTPVYNTAGQLRLYAKNTLTFEATEGYVINTVAITYTSYKSGKLLNNGAEYATGGVITVNGSKLELKVTSSGQARVTEITVTYTASAAPTPVEQTPAEKVAAALEKVEDKINVTTPKVISLPASEVDGVTFGWAYAEGTTVDENLFLLSSDTGELLVNDLPEEETTLTLVLTATCGEANDSKNVTVTISSKYNIKTTLDFVTQFGTYAKEWSNSYGPQTIQLSDLGETALIGNIAIDRASKQTGTITNMPVLASKGNTEYATLKLDSENLFITAVTFDFAKWSSDTFDEIYIQYTLDNGKNWVTCSDNITTPATLSSTEIPNGVTQVRLAYYKSGTSNKRMGLSSIALTTKTVQLSTAEKIAKEFTEVSVEKTLFSKVGETLTLGVPTVDGVTFAWSVPENNGYLSVVNNVLTVDNLPAQENATVVLKLIASYTENGAAATKELPFDITVKAPDQPGTKRTLNVNVDNLDTSNINQIALDENIMLFLADGTNTSNSPVYNDYLRVYSGNTVQFKASEGYIIQSVKFTYTEAGNLEYNTVTYGKGAEIPANSSDFTLNVVDGKMFITEIQVKYVMGTYLGEFNTEKVYGDLSFLGCSIRTEAPTGVRFGFCLALTTNNADTVKAVLNETIGYIHVNVNGADNEFDVTNARVEGNKIIVNAIIIGSFKQELCEADIVTSIQLMIGNENTVILEKAGEKRVIKEVAQKALDAGEITAEQAAKYGYTA